MPFIEYKSKRILFIHIPRTGGTSIETWLASIAPLRFRSVGVPPAMRCTPQHLRMADFSSLFGDDYFDYVFTVVRNPFTRLESEYRLRRRLQMKGFYGEATQFPMWLEQSLQRATREPWHLDNHLRPQWEFIEDNMEIFRFEDGIDSIIAKIAASIGAPSPCRAPVKLGTGDEPHVEWTASCLQRMRTFYSADLEILRYSPQPDERSPA